LGPDGNFYGTNAANFPASSGLIFKMTPAGAFSTLAIFTSPDVATAISGLTLGSDGNFYGAWQRTTSVCTEDCGSVFKITPAGALSGLHSFSGSDGESGFSTLTLGPDGNFYGTAEMGGPTPNGPGTIYRISPSGNFTTVYNFSSADGQSPIGGLTLGPDGNFYGTTLYGGATPYGGTIFRFTLGGILTTLNSMSGSGGLQAQQPVPTAALALGPDGKFYGTTRYGGGCTYTLTGCGTIFRVSLAGDFDTIYSFNGTDGLLPVSGLTLGADGNFYGTTYSGGSNTSGTLFRLNLPHTPPAFPANGLVNAASFTAPVAPGSIATLFGTFALPYQLTTTSYPTPTALNGLSIQIGSAPLAPLFFASQSQVNFQVPWELAGQTQTTISVSQYQQTAAVQPLTLTTYSPGIFIMNSQTNQGAILDSNYNLVGPTNPTTVNAYIQIYCTGLGPVSNQPATGAPALADPLSKTPIMPAVTIGGVTTSPVFSGLVPGDVGLYQLNVQIPAGVPTGSTVPLTISIGGVTSNTVTVAIH
jgi:uncharacterized protein (TIGR03437 family)